ncbi:hypothetical protein TorRG33x02_009110 [Trema orientale]|uniref:Uncharacterized protein n=1 Tax=Trema orientale TaxID=63057 RepID=A0A2P5FYI0_TREOI|nr:hypothetical protein TorRG33x02_009110 [Trema orientale]
MLKGQEGFGAILFTGRSLPSWLTGSSVVRLIWAPFVPLRRSFLLWRATHDKLPAQDVPRLTGMCLVFRFAPSLFTEC